MDLNERVERFFDMNDEEFTDLLVQAGFEFEKVEAGKGGVEFGQVKFTLQANEQPAARVEKADKVNLTEWVLEVSPSREIRVLNFPKAC